ncbi:MAG: hypothetical protein K0Q55_345 [Verrucomicrobia bacterium]|nr:hypothetical protein [Verrucomicrobiota bacterium]
MVALPYGVLMFRKLLLPTILSCLAVAATSHAAMTVGQVQTVLAQAATRAAQVSPNSVIAVTDREGYVLGVWSVNGTTPTTAAFTNLVANAIAKAGTAAFLSSDQHAFTTRTAGFIVQQNFPPGVLNRPPGPLVGVNFSNLPFSDINRFKDPGTFVPGPPSGTNGGVVPTPVTGGLAGTAGGVPLYAGGLLIGGVGVAGDGDGATDITPQTVLAADIDEDVALAGQTGFAPASEIRGSGVFIDGIRIPYVESSTTLGPVTPLGGIGVNFAAYPVVASPALVFPAASLGGTTGELRNPIIADPSAVALPNGETRLTAPEVTAIIIAAAEKARTTRAGIRLPRGSQMQCFISVVNNPNVDGQPPVVLGSYGTSPDATRFSWDVSVQKARTALFFSSGTRAYSTRTVGFMAQRFYPPGIDSTTAGIFLGLQERFSLFPQNVTNPLNGAVVTTDAGPVPGAPNGNLPNGITIFAGGVPLYRNGVLIGAIGVSGDGIDQDDLVAAAGAAALNGIFLPPEAIRGDRTIHRGARLPFVKFPRNPAL